MFVVKKKKKNFRFYPRHAKDAIITVVILMVMVNHDFFFHLGHGKENIWILQAFSAIYVHCKDI